MQNENFVPDYKFVDQSFAIFFFVVLDCLLYTDCFDAFPVDDYFLSKNKIIAE